MEILNIPGLNNMAAESYASAEKRKAPTSQKQEDKDSSTDNQQNLSPEDVHNYSRLNPEVLADFHGLSLDQARSLLGDVAPEIANLHPWRLAELQPVVDRSLIPSAYV
jgi:hypothetical protein